MPPIQTLTDFLVPVTVKDKQGNEYTIVPQCLCGDNVLQIRAYLRGNQERAAKTLLAVCPESHIRDVASQLFEDMQKTPFDEIASLLDPQVIRIVLNQSIQGIRDKPEDERKQIVNSVMEHNSVAALCTAIIKASGELTLKNCMGLLSELRSKTIKLSRQSDSDETRSTTPATSTPTSSSTVASPPEKLESSAT